MESELFFLGIHCSARSRHRCSGCERRMFVPFSRMTETSEKRLRNFWPLPMTHQWLGNVVWTRDAGLITETFQTAFYQTNLMLGCFKSSVSSSLMEEGKNPTGTDNAFQALDYHQSMRTDKKQQTVPKDYVNVKNGLDRKCPINSRISTQGKLIFHSHVCVCEQFHCFYATRCWCFVPHVYPREIHGVDHVFTIYHTFIPGKVPATSKLASSQWFFGLVVSATHWEWPSTMDVALVFVMQCLVRFEQVTDHPMYIRQRGR